VLRSSAYYQSLDAEDASFYCDPPYVGADQGHYDGYTQMDFEALLKLLESIRGRFLLSSYRNEALRDFTKRNGWHTVELRMACSMTHAYKTKRQKIEVLTANYPIEIKPEKRVRRNWQPGTRKPGTKKNKGPYKTACGGLLPAFKGGF
jgi:DNA adenine methylase